ncbi:alpha/beta-hydrolase [Atractiella rhizophila]|nr:alpha/beta-hydrolase [Atractiella rhizophila]
MNANYIYLRSVAALLRSLAGIMQGKKPALPAGITKTRIEIESRDAGRKITVDVYERDGAKGVQPVHINAHGSGFVIPSHGDDGEFCAHLALKAGVVVLDADYRKAPEHPFPSAYNDILDVIAYARSQSSIYDGSRISVSGFSAGANLVMSTAVNLEIGAIKTVVSFYGNTNLTESFDAPSSNYDSGIIITPRLRKFFYSSLLQNGEDRRDTRLSPHLADPERWPNNVMLVCGEADDLWGAGKATADKLQGAGKNVKWISVENEAHSFDKRAKGAASEKRKWEAYDQAAEFVSNANGNS